jgi:N-acetylmuramoyl-L-alanine amidase
MNKTLFKFCLLLFIFIFTPIFSAHAQTPIKILLVPGHDDESWGAQYGNLKEADMNLVLAKKIFNILKQDKRFEVHIARDSNGYTKEFADYFANNQEDIILFKEDAKKKMQEDIISGNFIQKENNPHLNASEDVAIKLYGLNKWANENKMDAVIHIHFNDYPRPTAWTKGTYKGFAIYIPDGEMENWKESGQLGANIFIQLKKKYVTSTYERELGGLVPDQKLIALGSNDTLLQSVRSILIEYGYIYRFGNSIMRHQAYDTMADLTAKGVKNYFLKIK